jgi:hypothetical protein
VAKQEQLGEVAGHPKQEHRNALPTVFLLYNFTLFSFFLIILFPYTSIKNRFTGIFFFWVWAGALGPPRAGRK